MGKGASDAPNASASVHPRKHLFDAFKFVNHLVASLFIQGAGGRVELEIILPPNAKETMVNIYQCALLQSPDQGVSYSGNAVILNRMLLTA